MRYRKRDSPFALFFDPGGGPLPLLDFAPCWVWCTRLSRWNMTSLGYVNLDDVSTHQMGQPRGFGSSDTLISSQAMHLGDPTGDNVVENSACVP